MGGEIQNLPRRHAFVKARILGQVASAGADGDRIALRVQAKDAGRAAGRMDQPKQDFNRGRFTRPIRPNQGNFLAGRNA